MKTVIRAVMFSEVLNYWLNWLLHFLWMKIISGVQHTS